MLEEGLELSAQNRIDYYKRLTPLSLDTVENLESDLDAIEEQFIAYKDFLVHDQVAAERAKATLRESIGELKRNYREHYIDTILLESINKDSSYADFAFFKEVTINIVVNKLVYLAEIEANVQYHMKSIVSELLCRDRVVDPGAVRFSIDIPYDEKRGPETHNRGKLAAFISFFLEGELLGKVVYKPRSGRIDKKVIKLFDDINHLDRADRSSPYRLPTYVILSLGSASVWEFIGGNTLFKSNSVGRFIRTKQGKEREILSAKLNRMDAILTHAHISDLHPENVFVKGISGKSPEIIPIDLENIQSIKHARTGLGGQPHLVELTKAELALIKAFNKSTYDIEYRYLPYGTRGFVNLITDHTNAEALAKLIARQLIKDGYNLCTDITNLSKECLRDMLSFDVPYFTESQGKLYYGTVERGVIIAECESDE